MQRKEGILVICLSIIFLVIMSLFEIRQIPCIYLKTLWHNIKFIAEVIAKTLPLLIIVVIVYLLCKRKWKIRVDKFSIGGLDLRFNYPVRIYKKQVRDFLNTKRSIFKIDTENDNFKEVLDSYYEIYVFFRDNINILENVHINQITEDYLAQVTESSEAAATGESETTKIHKEEKIDEETELYALTNVIIQKMNEFLTMNQNNYRRWYSYVEKGQDTYKTPIGELQKDYYNYEGLCKEFKRINDFFCSNIVEVFNIDISKWGIKKN